MKPTDRDCYWIKELDEAARHAVRCQAHCTPEAHGLFALVLSRLRTCQEAAPSMDRVDIQVRAFRSMLSSIAFADLMGVALPAARPRILALARKLCETELPVNAGGAMRFLFRANSLQGRMMEIHRDEAFQTDHPASQRMLMTAPDGW